MNIQQYLHRINFTEEEIKLDLDTLKKLQKLHLFHVPFENLDIHNGVKIELDIDRVFTKVVTTHRGGFCYELNGLFYKLLKALGFKAKRIAARVYSPEKGYGFEYDHLAIIVHISGNDYIVDVGFGDFTYHPLKLELETVQEDERGQFRIEKHDETYLRVSKYHVDQWVPEYIFTETPRAYNEYADMCHYHQTSPDSHFTKQRMCTLPTQEGRVTISKNKIKITRGEEVTEDIFTDEAAYHQALKQYFNIELNLAVS